MKYADVGVGLSVGIRWFSSPSAWSRCGGFQDRLPLKN